MATRNQQIRQNKRGILLISQPRGSHSTPILLVTEALQEEVDRFAVLRYADFCLALRQFVVANKHDERGYVFLSFILALAATFEMNLLGLMTYRQCPP